MLKGTITKAVALFDEWDAHSYASRATVVPDNILYALYAEAHRLLCSKEVEYLRYKYEQHIINSFCYAYTLRDYIMETDRVEDFV